MAEPRQYRLKQQPVEAMQHDGTVPRAYEILAWVTRNRGAGRLEDGYSSQGPDMLLIGGMTPVAVIAEFWVVKTAEGFRVMSDDEFRETYEPAPVMATIGGTGGGGSGAVGGISNSIPRGA